MSIWKHRFANRLQLARTSVNLTQGKMGELLGKADSTIDAYEQGVNNVPADIVMAYCDICGGEPNLLFDYMPPSENPEDYELKRYISRYMIHPSKGSKK